MGVSEIVDRPPAEGGLLESLSWAGSVALLLACTAGVTSEDLSFVVPVVALPMFIVGTLAMLLAFFGAIGRSRSEEIGMGGLYLLLDSAPKRTGRSFQVSLAAQVVVALVSASVRPYTQVAFAILAPLWGLGVSGLWGARHGTFDAR